MGERLRKTQYNLVVAGTGVIAFGVWSMIKAVMYLLMQSSELRQSMNTAVDEIIAEENASPEAGIMVQVIMIILVLVVLGVDLLLRLYVGLCARAEGFGRKKSRIYIVLALLMAAGAFLNMVVSMVRISYLDETIIDSVVTFLVDLTSFFILVELSVSAILLKRMTRERKEDQEQGGAVCR